MSDALPAALPAADVLVALLTTCPTGVIVFRPVHAAGEEGGELVDLAYVHLNPAAQQQLRRPACPLETFLTLYPGARATGIFAFYRDTFLSGQPGYFDGHHPPDGLDNDVHLAAQRAGDLLVVSFTNTAHHARGATEADLRASQVREQAARAGAEAQRVQFQALLEQAPVAIAFFEGPAQRITAANSRMCAIWDRAPKQVLGRPLLEALPELRGQGVEGLIAQAMATGQPVSGAEAPATMWRDGQLQTTYYNFVFQPFHDEQGQVQGVIEVASEVTAQVLARQQIEDQAHQLTQLNQELEARVLERTQALRHAQAEAEATAQKLLRVTESQPSISFTVDQKGQVLYISPQWYAYTGLEPGIDITAAWPQFIHPDDLALVAEQYGAALVGGGSWRYEFRLRGTDGQYRWFANQGVPEPLAEAEAAGRPRQWFGSTLNIDELKRAQQQLEEKDQLLTSILSSLPASVVTFEGEDLRFGFFNDTFQRQAQGRAVPGHPAGEAFPEAEEQGFLALLREVLRTGEPYQAQEVPAQTSDPRTRQPQEMYLDLTYLPLRHGQQPPYAVLGFTLNATERVRARQQAEAAQARALAAAEQTAAQREAFFQVFEQTSACIALLREPHHRYEYVNDAYQQLFPDHALLGRTVTEAFPMAVEQGFVALLDQVFRTGEPYVGREMLLSVAQPDGQPAHDFYFDFTYQVVREVGQTIGISVFAFDATERVLARQQREAQRVQLAELFEQAPVAITVLRGPQYVVEVANPLVAQLWGRTPEQVRGKTLYEALPEVRDQGFKELLDQVVASGEAFVAQEVPAQLPRAGQLTTVYLNFVYQPLRDAQGRIERVAAVATDVTVQVLARQQLAQANEQLTAANQQLIRTNTDLDNFIYTASHDLRQPIANIEGLLNALHEELPAALRATSGLVDPILDRMMESVERFKRTIDSLTDITRLQREHQPASAPVSLAAVLNDVCFDLDGLLAAPDVHLTHDVAGCPPLLFPEKNLRSVLYNLLSNALKYRSPHRPLHVAISCRAVPGYQVLEVHDNGLGIAPAQQPRLFRMFQRFHDHVAGTGIGLYMVKRMVENAGGRIEVHSQEGTGTTFSVYFPVPPGLPA